MENKEGNRINGRFNTAWGRRKEDKEHAAKAKAELESLQYAASLPDSNGAKTPATPTIDYREVERRVHELCELCRENNINFLCLTNDGKTMTTTRNCGEAFIAYATRRLQRMEC